MPLTKSLLILMLPMLLVVTATADSSGKGPGDDQATVLLHKACGKGEIVCTAGANLAPALLRDLAGNSAADRYLAFYEFRVDWQVPGSPPIRLWSTLFAVGRQYSSGGAIFRVQPSSPESRSRVAVLDVAVIPPPRDLVMQQLVIALRSPGGGGFSLDRVDIGGGARSWWAPPPEGWTGYEVSTDGDPSSVTLTVSPEGLCRAEVISGKRHTTYEQLEGKWEFAEVHR